MRIAEWFEVLERCIGFELPQFAYAQMTRSQRVSHENLRLRDPQWLSGVERWFAAPGRDSTATQPRFTPSHAVHYSARAPEGK